MLKDKFSDILFSKLKWRVRHDTPALVVIVASIMNETLVALEHLPGHLPPTELSTSLTTELYIYIFKISVYHWDDFNDKSMCFYYGEVITT